MYPTNPDSPSTDDVDKSLYDSAKRHLNTLTPETASTVKTAPHFWTRHVLELFFERCEHAKLDRPAEALNEAKHLADLASVIPVGREPGKLRSEAERLSWRVRCLGLEAEIAGLAGCRSYMRAAIDRAVSMATDERTEIVAVAELLRRQAATAMREGHFDNAVRSIDLAEGFYRQLDPDIGLGETLILYGLVKKPLSDGLVAVSEVLCRFSPDESEYAGRLFDAGLSMLIGSHGWQTTEAHGQAMLGWLYNSRKTWLAGRKRCPRRLAVVWAEARALIELRLARLAQRRLNTVWLRFSALGMCKQMVVASLDLAVVLIRDEEHKLAVEVLRTTEDRVRRLNGDPDLKGILKRAESMTPAELGELRRQTARRFLPSVGEFLPLRHPKAPLGSVGERNGSDFS